MSSVKKECVGLVLSGGGARAAYQVGVLKAIAQICPKEITNPFPVVCGTSAGAINTTALASYPKMPFRHKIKRLEISWRKLHCHDVYCTNVWGVLSYSTRWISGIFFGGGARHKPVSLLNNKPLGTLLSHFIHFENIQKNIESGELHAVSVTACGYETGKSVSFFQARQGCEGWDRAHSHGIPTAISVEHLMATSSIPFIFPATKIGEEFFGDGNLRQVSPLRPALKFGADKVLVIGVSPLTDLEPSEKEASLYPSLAQTADHVLNSLFLDCLEMDLERLENIENTLDAIPKHVLQRSDLNLKTADVLVLSPSKNLNEIAEKHIKDLPRVIRLMLRGIGVTRHSGSAILSYLLFEEPFCNELIQLGYQDTIARKEEVADFLFESTDHVSQPDSQRSRFRMLSLFR